MSQTDRGAPMPPGFNFTEQSDATTEDLQHQAEDREGCRQRVSYVERLDRTPTRQARTHLGINVSIPPPHHRAFKQPHDRLDDTDGTEIPWRLLQQPAAAEDPMHRSPTPA